MPTSPGTFTMCGSTCPSHAELRCDLAQGHDRPISLLFNPTTKPTWHKSGRVRWNNHGHHKHMTFAEVAAEEIEKLGVFDGPRIHVSENLPSGHAYLIGARGGAPHWADLVFPTMAEWKGNPETHSVMDETEEPSSQAKQVDELSRWWLDKAKLEIGQTVAKAVEYGSTDLIDIGHDLARVADRDLDDEEAAEWGIYFYILGKLSRWRSAMERGDRVSDDTLLDIGVYVRMAQRVREAGGWPGTEGDDE